jgi:ADP-ribose pyrophosphatase
MDTHFKIDSIIEAKEALIMDKFRSVKVVKSKIVYNKHGRQIVEDTLEFADGSKHEWIYFKCGRAAGIAAFTKDNKMILTKQYRHPFGKVVLDLPGGSVEEGETPMQAAQREFEEETGFTAKKLERIGKYNPGPNSQIVVNIFFTRDTKLKGKLNEEEIVNVELVDFKAMLKKVLEGECFDSALAIAVLLVASKNLVPS